MAGRLNSQGYVTSQGVHVQQDAITSVVARAGVSVGQELSQKKGSYYLNVSVLNDFSGESKARYSLADHRNQTQIKDVTSVDLDAFWSEIGFGGTYRLNDRFMLYGECGGAFGSKIKNPFQWTVGARFDF